MGRGDQVGGVRRSLGVSESLLRQSLLEIDTATFARMVSRGLLHGKTFLSRPLTVRIYFKFSVTQFDNVLWGRSARARSPLHGIPGKSLHGSGFGSVSQATWDFEAENLGFSVKFSCRATAPLSSHGAKHRVGNPSRRVCPRLLDLKAPLGGRRGHAVKRTLVGQQHAQIVPCRHWKGSPPRPAADLQHVVARRDEPPIYRPVVLIQSDLHSQRPGADIRVELPSQLVEAGVMENAKGLVGGIGRQMDAGRALQVVAEQQMIPAIEASTNDSKGHPPPFCRHRRFHPRQ